MTENDGLTPDTPKPLESIRLSPDTVETHDISGGVVKPAENPNPDSPNGGQGGTGNLLLERGHTRGDSILARRAAKERWPVKNSVRRMVVERLAQVIKTADNARDIVNASRALIAADSLNVTESKPGASRPSVNVQVNVANGPQRTDEESRKIVEAAEILRLTEETPE